MTFEVYWYIFWELRFSLDILSIRRTFHKLNFLREYRNVLNIWKNWQFLLFNVMSLGQNRRELGQKPFIRCPSSKISFHRPPGARYYFWCKNLNPDPKKLYWGIHSCLNVTVWPPYLYLSTASLHCQPPLPASNGL